MCSVWPSKLSAAISRSVVRSFGKDRTSSTKTSSKSSSTTSTTTIKPTSTPANSSPILLTPFITTHTPPTPSATTTISTTTTTTTTSISITSMSGSKKDGGTRDLVTEARSFTSSLTNVFLMKKRDPQSKHLLEKAQLLIEALLAENQKLTTSTRPGPATPRQLRTAGSMGQLWVKLDELKRENDDLRRQRGRSQDDRSCSPKEKGPGEVIISDLQKTKTDNECLKTQVSQLQKSVRELQAVNGSLQDEYKRSKAALDAAQRSVEKSRQDYKKLDATLTALRAEYDAVKQKAANNSSGSNNSSSSPAKLTMSPVLRSDNRLTENISERCRPSTIAVRYNTLESQQWVDAKESMEDDPHLDMDENQIVCVLCEALMSTYTASQRLSSNVELVISELLRRPTLAKTIIDNHLQSQCQHSSLTEDLADLVKQKLRQTTDNLDSGVVSQMAEEHQNPNTRQTLQRLSSNKAVHGYLKECATVTWQMAVQNPPMTLVADDPTFNDVRHKLWWSCDQSRARNVDLFVWPILFDYPGGNILVKGCVSAS